MFGNDEYNDYEEYENFDNSDEIREAAERAREAMIAKSVEMNYKHIVGKGFSGMDLKLLEPQEKVQVIETIEYMVDFFEAREAYEKCAILMKALAAVNEGIDFKPVVDIY